MEEHFVAGFTDEMEKIAIRRRPLFGRRKGEGKGLLSRLKRWGSKAETPGVPGAPMQIPERVRREVIRKITR
jgi:hypothetical protein